MSAERVATKSKKWINETSMFYYLKDYASKQHSKPLRKCSPEFEAEIYAFGSFDKCAQFNLDPKYRIKEIAILPDSHAATIKSKNM